MKLRMLNGTHSMLAYAGFLAGSIYVRDVMANAALQQRVDQHLAAAAATLVALAGIDFADYAQQLIARFCNPEIAHETYQIAMDGSEKLPQRILIPAVYALQQQQDIAPFAYAAAAWMRYCVGVKSDGICYELRDPREAEIRELLRRAEPGAAGISRALHALPEFFPNDLLESALWQSAVETALDLPEFALYETKK